MAWPLCRCKLLRSFNITEALCKVPPVACWLAWCRHRYVSGVNIHRHAAAPAPPPSARPAGSHKGRLCLAPRPGGAHRPRCARRLPSLSYVLHTSLIANAVSSGGARKVYPLSYLMGSRWHYMVYRYTRRPFAKILAGCPWFRRLKIVGSAHGKLCKFFCSLHLFFGGNTVCHSVRANAEKRQ